MTDYPEYLARNLVRTFSISLTSAENTPNNKDKTRKMLDEAFREAVVNEDESRVLLQEENQTKHSKALETRYHDLEAAVAEFWSSFPQLNSQKESSKALTWSSLRQNIANLKSQHEMNAKRGIVGRSKSQFHRICEAMNNHSNVMKVFPQGDKYTSLVCGSLEMIVKASVNHELIGQKFSDTLKEIDDIVASVRRELEFFDAPYLKESGVRLRCEILTFVTITLKWYSSSSWKRVSTAFNQNVLAEYQRHRNEIDRISKVIQRDANFCGNREMIDGIGRSYRKLQDIDRRLLIVSQYIGGLCDGKIGPPMKRILDDKAAGFVQDRDDNSEIEDNQVNEDLMMTSASATDVPSVAQTILGATRTETDILAASEVLDRHFDANQIAVAASYVNNFVEIEAIQHLQEWIQQSHSGTLAIFGPASISEDSATQIMTSSFVEAAKSSGVPFISYFCAIASAKPAPNRSRETVGLVALLYALIKQTISHLPQQLDFNAHQLDLSLFESLDGTLRTWDEAITLLKQLFNLIDTTFLLIAIHGIELLEHDATEQKLTTLVNLLNELTADPGEDGTLKVIKILFATTGNCRVLASQMRDDCVLDVNRGNAASAPGHVRGGRTSMGHLSL